MQLLHGVCTLAYHALDAWRNPDKKMHAQSIFELILPHLDPELKSHQSVANEKKYSIIIACQSESWKTIDSHIEDLENGTTSSSLKEAISAWKTKIKTIRETYESFQRHYSNYKNLEQQYKNYLDQPHVNPCPDQTIFSTYAKAIPQQQQELFKLKEDLWNTITILKDTLSFSEQDKQLYTKLIETLKIKTTHFDVAFEAPDKINLDESTLTFIPCPMSFKEEAKAIQTAELCLNQKFSIKAAMIYEATSQSKLTDFVVCYKMTEWQVLPGFTTPQDLSIAQKQEDWKKLSQTSSRYTQILEVAKLAYLKALKASS